MRKLTKLLLLGFMTILCIGLNSCSKEDDSTKGDGEDDKGGIVEGYAPAFIVDKTLQIKGQTFYVIFNGTSICKIVPQYSWEIITNTPTYTYNKQADDTAILSFFLKDKIVTGTGYTLSETTYDLTLNFDSRRTGSLKGGWKGYITINTGIDNPSTSHYSSADLSDKTLTLDS